MENIRINSILQGDCLEELKKLPDNSVDAIDFTEFNEVLFEIIQFYRNRK